MFDIRKLFTGSNTDSCYNHIMGGVNIYLYGSVGLLTPVCIVCLRLCEYDIKSGY